MSLTVWDQPGVIEQKKKDTEIVHSLTLSAQDRTSDGFGVTRGSVDGTTVMFGWSVSFMWLCFSVSVRLWMSAVFDWHVVWCVLDSWKLQYSLCLCIVSRSSLWGVSVMEATGKYDFAATAEDELSFRKGDIIKVCFNIYMQHTSAAHCIVQYHISTDTHMHSTHSVILTRSDTLNQSLSIPQQLSVV